MTDHDTRLHNSAERHYDGLHREEHNEEDAVPPHALASEDLWNAILGDTVA